MTKQKDIIGKVKDNCPCCKREMQIELDDDCFFEIKPVDQCLTCCGWFHKWYVLRHKDFKFTSISNTLNFWNGLIESYKRGER